MKKKILVATTNKGKLKEIYHFFDDLSVEILTLDDLVEDIIAPEETGVTIQENAMLKARYYGEKTGFLTLADDSGLFVDALDGWPGVKSARVGETSDVQCTTLLSKLKEESGSSRSAQFQVCLALYDPNECTFFTTFGKTNGQITEEVTEAEVVTSYGFNKIFFVEKDDRYPEATGKTYAEMSLQEKNSVSHRGKALIKMKYHIADIVSPKHIILAIGIIIQDGKVLVNKRNDPHNLDHHEKWEFPGGAMDFGETLEDNLKREVFEEAGYVVDIIDNLGKIYINPTERVRDNGSIDKYQLYIIPHICRVVSGDGKYSDNEVLESRWAKVSELKNYDFIDSKERIEEIVQLIEKKITAHNL
ncbi:MAG: hypothetical protein CL685_02925 [Candidatus Magasanikbacteria bacterium]|nr:hypothetical protein [Candidatus Magasanikbacteria bacterium]